MMAVLSNLEVFFWLSACLVFVMLSGLFSGSETGLYCVNSTRLRLAAHKQDPAALRLQNLLTDRAGLLFTTLFGTNLANYLAPVCLTVVFLESISVADDADRERRAELYTTLILTPTVFIFGEIVPKNVFQRDADRLMSRVSSALRVTHLLFKLTGIIWIQRHVSAFVAGRLQRQPESGSALHTRMDVYEMLREGAAGGALSVTQSTILERIHRLKAIPVGAIMVRAHNIDMLSAEAKRSEVERVIRKSPYSRMPVYRDSRRRIVGVVHVLDILTGPQNRPIGDMTHPPLEITADQSVTEALGTLQQQYRRMAIVVDKAGRCIGLVTVKDLVEEIVGDLAAW
ncbi:MAG: CNNM domain-containing protein [Phycisphaerales bacterium]|nr:CNNM domain-containing protein [Phycisphaerales bacterium]